MSNNYKMLTLSYDGLIAWGYIPRERMYPTEEYRKNVVAALDWYFTMLAVLRIDRGAELIKTNSRHPTRLQWDTFQLPTGLRQIFYKGVPDWAR